MGNVFITPDGQESTSVQLPEWDAAWLADQLERLADPSDTPAAPTAASRIREAIAPFGETEVRLSRAELDTIRRVFELNPDGNGSPDIARLQAELRSWTT
jgi:hypothetical protein